MLVGLSKSSNRCSEAYAVGYEMGVSGSRVVGLLGNNCVGDEF